MAPLLFTVILWRHHLKGADFAYPIRIILWEWVSFWSHHAAPVLSGRRIEIDGPLQPVEQIYTDDMGFSFLVYWTTCFIGRQMTRPDFFCLISFLNLSLLWIFLGSLVRWPLAAMGAAFLLFFPSFYIPEKVIGPDLFTLYGTLALSGIGAMVLIVHSQRRTAWIAAGILMGSIYFLRQAIGMMMIFTLLVSVLFWWGDVTHRSFRQSRRWFYAVGGALLVWLGFHGTLAWRDAQLGLPPGQNNSPKHHTIFHPLYVGIGNIQNNPWGIVYADKFAYDQIMGEQKSDQLVVYSEKYLTSVRDMYLSLWRKDGWRLFQCYLRHFCFVVGKTLGYIPFLLGYGYFLFLCVLRIRSSHLQTVSETCLTATAAILMAFLIQSTLIDYQQLFSYPTGLLGRYLLGFCFFDGVRRYWIHRCGAGS